MTRGRPGGRRAKLKVNVADAYISGQPSESQAVLQRVRGIIRRVLPSAEETISYQIPTYKVAGRGVVAFAGWKHHWSIYPVTEAVRVALGPEADSYEFSKGTMRFPLAAPTSNAGTASQLIPGVGRTLLAR